MSTRRQTQQTPWDDGGYAVMVPRFGRFIPSTQVSFSTPCVRPGGDDAGKSAYIDLLIAKRKERAA